MMKKLICMVLSLFVISSVFMINVGAAELMSVCDFTMDEGETERDGWSATLVGASTVTVADDPLDPENKVLALTHDPLLTSGGGAITQKNCPSPANGELVCMFDIMFAKSQSSVFILAGANGMRYSASYSTESFGSPMVWYSVILHLEEGSAYGNLYKKVKDSDADYVRITTDRATAANNLAGMNFYTTKGKLSSEGDPDIIYIDNCRVYNGLYMEDIKFMLGDTEITSVAEINEGGVFTASYNLMNADLSEESEGLESEFTTMLPALVVFDKKGKMVDCVSYEAEMELLDNSVELTVDISNYYEKLDGGCAKLYVLDSLRGLQVLMDEVILPAN